MTHTLSLFQKKNPLLYVLILSSDFTLKVSPGESVAFVGPSGCGKSTLFSLLLRFYDPTQGAVVVDEDHDLKDLNIRWWLRNVGVVSQV